jgi:hypothetical protein
MDMKLTPDLISFMQEELECGDPERREAANAALRRWAALVGTEDAGAKIKADMIEFLQGAKTEQGEQKQHPCGGDGR